MRRRAETLDARPDLSQTDRHPSGRVTIDDLDRRILAELLRDGRMPYRKVAASLGVSTTTVSSRVARLHSLKVMKGTAALVDFERLGYELTAVTEIIVSKGKLIEMEREIAKLPEVCAVYDVTGEIDAIVVAKFRTREEMGHFTKGLLTMPFVERANTHLVLTTVKENFRIPL